MAVLKKGAKGPAVKKLQESLNKNGAKLKPDGDFGKNTEIAVKQFQKKAKLRKDGVVGPMTEAALKFGGQLPKMPIEDYSKIKEKVQKNHGDNLMTQQDYAVIASILNILDSMFLKQIEAALNASSRNKKHFKSANKMMDEIIKLQTEFDNNLLTDPKASAKIAKDCEKKEAVLLKLVEGEITKNRNAAALHLKKGRKLFGDKTGQVDKMLSNIHKRANS